MRDIKNFLGDEYPAAIVRDDVRVPLYRETRFTRIFRAPNRKEEYHLSRFMDGSASISAAELQCQWPAWTSSERDDFCQACGWLQEQQDFQEMLRFILQHSGPDEWSAIALEVASTLPKNEAFDFLVRALRSTDIPGCCNLVQGIAATEHPESESVLRGHLTLLWNHPKLWDGDYFVNWLAYGATTCILHLLKLGAGAGEFEHQVERLSQHVCSRNRDSCVRHLAKYYPGLSLQGTDQRSA